MASSSAWLWDASHQLYYNSSTQVWAAPKADGTWQYSTPPASSTSSRRAADYTDLDDPAALPEDQVWPDEEEPSLQDRHAHTPLLRLVLRSLSSLFPAPQAVALVDPTEPVSIGRDKSYTPRVRLKELPVSKDHAVVCWVEEDVRLGKSQGYWAVVDSGSTHGTFLGAEGKEKRLSETKIASAPHELQHLDTLRVGSTVFNVHIHPSLACSDCSVATDSSNLIPLLSAEPTPVVKEAAPDTYVTKTKAQKEQERREKMRGLKDQFLKPAGSTPSKGLPDVKGSTTIDGTPAEARPAFIDRAAARRSRTGVTTKPPRATGGPPPKPSTAASPFFAVPGSRAAPDYASSPSQPPADPFSATSKGALLLSKLGGGGSSAAVGSSPSSGAGSGLGTLIQTKSVGSGARDERPGLGSRPLVAVGGEDAGLGAGAAGDKRGWRDDAREANRKRFKGI